MRAPWLVVRVDAGPAVGAGHAMRCLALAQTWRVEGGEVIFVMRDIMPWVGARLKREGIPVSLVHPGLDPVDDARLTVRMAREVGADWLLVDGYGFGATYQRSIRKLGGRVAAIDDLGQIGRHEADVIIDHNLGATASFYEGSPREAHLLLGPRYVLLRQEFTKWAGGESQIPVVARRLVISLGGSAAPAVLGTVLPALADVVRRIGGEITVVVVAGTGEVEERVCRSAGEGVAVRLVPPGPEMPALLAQADLGITGSGTTVWEAAFLGLPILIVVLADNQRRVAEGLSRAGLAISLGWHETLQAAGVGRMVAEVMRDAGLRAEMSRRGRALVDGEGPARVVMVLRQLPLRLRPVRRADAQMLWRWANDPEVRAASFSSEPIAWEAHVAWLENRLRDPDTLFFIAIDGEDRPIGQIRFDVAGKEAVVSVTVDRPFRRAGLGSRLIALASARAFRERPIDVVRAYVKPANTASMQAFVRAGYLEAGTVQVRGEEVRQFLLTSQRAAHA